jgi:hypothetical protein
MALLHIETSPATGAVAMYDLKELLKSAGHTVPSSGDGTTYFSASDGITTGASGAGGLGNTSAWFRLRLVNGEEFTFQRGATNLVWRIKHSRTGFGAGSPSATQTPSETNEAVLWGGGSDASPTYAALHATDGTFRWKGAAYDAAPYGWWATGIPVGGGNPNTGTLIYDPLIATQPDDTHKAIIHLSTTGLAVSFANTGSEEGGATQRRWGYVASSGVGALANFPACYPQSTSAPMVTNGATAGSGANPLTGFEEMIPPIYARRASTANPGWKGVGTIPQWSTTVRSSGAIVDMQDGTYRVRLVDLTLPWPIATWGL